MKRTRKRLIGDLGKLLEGRTLELVLDSDAWQALLPEEVECVDLGLTTVWNGKPLCEFVKNVPAARKDRKMRSIYKLTKHATEARLKKEVKELMENYPDLFLYIRVK